MKKKYFYSDLWIVYYYSKGKGIDFLPKKTFCNSLYLAYKYVERLMLEGFKVSSIERVDNLIDL